MYRYNEKLKKRSDAIKARLKKSITLPIAFILLVSPVAVFAKGGVDTSVSSVPKPTTAVPSYNLSLSNTGFSSNTLSVSGSVKITNFVDREDVQYISFNWGDGNTETQQIMTLPNYLKSSTVLTVSGLTKSHTYTGNGPWTIQVKIYANNRDGSILYSSASGQYQTSIEAENNALKCSDDRDNDNDGMRNLYDNDCADFRTPETTLGLCSDGVDNDVNGKTDLFDSNCAQFIPTEDNALACSDGADNDLDGRIDLKDLGCIEFIPTEDNAVACSDGLDNDLDGKVDLFDSSCALFRPSENTTEACTDGLDNDYDGLYNGNDPDCIGHVPAEDSADVCLDAIDNDFDGSFDWEDSGCAPFVVPVFCPTGFVSFFIPGFGIICGPSAGY